jgi:K(+)-stimulated pyrophosphate-energized sodium pump
MLLGLVLGISILGLVVAALLAKWVLAQDQGPDAMRKVANAIKEGAEAFLSRMNWTILKIAVPLAALIYILYAFVRTSTPADPADKGTLALWTAISFALGAGCSLFAGYVGMWISIRTNIRTAAAARTSLNGALQAALRGGAVSGLLVVGMSLLGVGGLYAIASAMDATRGDATKIPLLIVGYGFGASLVALFAQVGGGIYTKAADVGADLVGKVEAGIPEDDPRNPAVIADLVGDNVGDCAGRGADLFESTAAENIGAMILAASLATAIDTSLEASGKAGLSPEVMIGLMMFPLVARAFGIVASIAGLFFTKIREDQDPMDGLNRGYYVTSALAAVGFFVATKWLFTPFAEAAGHGEGWWKILVCGVIGIATAQAFVYITQYYTEYKYRPVREIADSSVTGPATNIISGIAVGLESTLVPVITVSIALVSSYMLGDSAVPGGGLFGTAVATMGMLGTAGYILAMDTFGPITDNAGGIVEMSNQPEEIRKRTDRLDSCGNTTKALTKGYAVGSAALAAFLLFSAYIDEVRHYAHGSGSGDHVVFGAINLAKPEVFVGALLGATLVFFFSALTIRAVGRAAKSVIEAVREQFKPFRNAQGELHLPDTFIPDYKKVVDIVTSGALRQMVLPGIIVVAAPVITGLVFKYVGKANGDATLGAEVVAGFLMVGTIAGILMALFLNNSGGAWDNAKKYIETGAHGGKRSEPHKAAVVGDTVGDPFKDTAGPSLHVLIKLLSTITLVLAPLFL